jgi:misacylated tRNA(Ala) deacylase
MTEESRNVLAASHTAEHVLNAVMQREYGTGRSIEAHFGAKKSKCDYRVRRPLSEDDVRKIEAAVNAEIAKDLPVTSFIVSRSEAEGRYDMGKVPASAESIRIVKIGDLDMIPCIGEHVERTSHIGRFEIRSTEMREEDRIRIRFLVRGCLRRAE